MTTDAEWRVKADQREQRSFTIDNKAGAPINVTGWVLDAKIRTRPGGLVLHTFPAEQAEIDGDGQVVLTIPAPVSAAWAWTEGWYRVKVTDPASDEDDPDRSRTLQGPLVVDPD